MNEEATQQQRTETDSPLDNDALNRADSEDQELAATAAQPVPAPEFHLPAVSDLKQQASDTATHALASAKTGVGQAYEVARKQVSDQLTSQKNQAADSLGGIKNSFQQIGETFAGNGQPALGEYAKGLGGQVDKVATYLRDSDLETLGHDAQQFAKANPAIVVGGAFLIGVALARFFKASEAMATERARQTALVPYSPNGGAAASRQDIDLDDAFTGNSRPITANGYVSGGVLGGAPA